LVFALAFTSACGVLDPSPTPTLILPDPQPVEQDEPTPPPTPTLEYTPTEALETSAETPTPALETPTQTPTPEQAALDTSPALGITPLGDWPMSNRDYDNARASLEASIGADTVGLLQEAWRFTVPGRVGTSPAFSNPVAHAGVVYIQDQDSNLYALDQESGDLRWEYRLDLPSTPPNGPGLGYGMVFIPAGDDQIHAVDMETGQLVWSRILVGAQGLHPPYLYGGLVLTGTSLPASGAGAADTDTTQIQDTDPATTAIIYALAQDTGEIVWQFEAAGTLWDNGETSRGAGVSYPPAIDGERGMAFWGTGSPAQIPAAAQFPEQAAELNLHASSILALELATGQLAWYGDLGPGDLFGQDARISPVLVEVLVEGQPRSLVIGAGRFGAVAALDRDSGEPVWRVTLGDSAAGVGETQDTGELNLLPGGFLSGVQSPMAAAGDTLYVAISTLQVAPPAAGEEPGQAQLSGAIDLSQAVGELAAVDAATGQLLWSRSFDSALIGGATVSGDLVFTVTYNGAIFALNRENGLVVWQAISAPEAHFLPAVVDDIILLPGSGSTNEFTSVVALRLGTQPTPIPFRTPTPTQTPTPLVEPTPFINTPTPDGQLPPPVEITPTPVNETPPVVPTPTPTEEDSPVIPTPEP
jgi:outer membrane protein assembly factor BamB